MKNLAKQSIYTCLIIVTLLLSSCEKSLNGIKGEGAIVHQAFEYENLKGIVFESTGNIHITDTITEQFYIKAQQNIINNFKLNVNNGIIFIEADRNIRSHDGIDIYLSADEVNKVILSGSGNIYSENTITHASTLELKIEGSGNITFDSDVNELYTAITGSGDVNLSVKANYLSTEISGSGKYNIEGEVNESVYSIDGSGTIHAYDLNTQTTQISNSGSVNLEVSVTDHLKVNISGSGNVYYKGDPTMSVNISGSGKVVKVD